jgi:hypothetical protein
MYIIENWRYLVRNGNDEIVRKRLGTFFELIVVIYLYLWLAPQSVIYWYLKVYKKSFVLIFIPCNLSLRVQNFELNFQI